MTNNPTIDGVSREIALFESIIGKKPEAFLHEPVYQVTESEVLEFARQISAPAVERQEPSATLADGIQSLERISASVDARQLRIDALKSAPELAAPPAPVAVVLPERMVWESAITDTSRGTVEGWNACLDATAALNRRDTPTFELADADGYEP